MIYYNLSAKVLNIIYIFALRIYLKGQNSMNKIWLMGAAVCMIVAFGSCKPKQSAYKAAYYMKGYFLGTKLSYVKSSK